MKKLGFIGVGNMGGFVAAFISGLFACKLMVALVKKSKMRWFALYCAVVAVLLLIFM